MAEQGGVTTEADVDRGSAKQVTRLDRVIIRFAGDSGDGMQLTGDRFTSETAQLGNDISTLPNFPAEIRAPAGTLPGVSSFQVHFADYDILTPGDSPHVLVAMNPAALKANLGDLHPGADIIVNTDEFTKRNLAKVGYAANPLEDGSLGAYALHPVALTSMTVGALAESGLGKKDAERSKNMFALGLLSWMYSRPHESTIRFLQRKFAKRPELVAANIAAFRAGWNYGETTEDFSVRYEVAPAAMPPGTYRNITGNAALALGLVAAGVRAKLPVFLGAYPITPASDILHELSRHKRFGVTTMQAEDEIAAIGAALGASYGGALGVTTTSGPGVALKSETISLAVALELPLVIVDVQRAGPSTGMPTKTEQADLNMALYGRHGEAPVAVIAPRSPSDCFHAAIEAARIAVTYRTPVILLSDNYVANGSEPWLLPDVESLPDLRVDFATEPNGDDGRFLPYLRDPQTLARPWAVPGTPGLEHRIGGLEKADRTGDISYDPANHDVMVRTRAAKIDGIEVPDVVVEDPDAGNGEPGARVLVLGWGSTYGPIGAACRALRQRGLPVAQAHLRHLAPLPANLGDVLAAYDRVVVPEMNLGQLAHVIRARYLVDAIPYNQVRGLPFTAAELEDMLEDVVKMASPTIPLTVLKQTAKDFKSDQEVRWCPGCGDYAVLAAVQGFMPELQIPRENIVFVSGIGCSSRFPYYMNTYGMHSIHGRAPAIATGLSASRPDLSVWVVTGDGDALSIGGNHLIHALRRNVNLKILLFNNRIYGLTKGQYSPTSELGKITKSTPSGSTDSPFNPLSLALGAEATFVARTIDSDRKHLQSVLRAAAEHQGSAFVEIYQNCNIFNDGAFEVLKDPGTRDDHLIRLEHGEPITFGAQGQFSVVHPAGGFGLEVRETAALGGEVPVVHDATVNDPAYAFALSRLSGSDLATTPVGVFRRVERPTYDSLVQAQLAEAKTQATGTPEQMLTGLLNAGDTWTIL